MKTLLLAAAAVLFAAPAMAQTQASTTDTVSADALILPGATAAPDCGGLYGMAGRAFCVSAPLTSIGALADAYVADLQGKGWIPADGDDNIVIFVRRRDAGGCDGLQMMAFYDTTKPTDDPAALGYLGFGAIRGDVCAAPEAQPAAPAPQQ
ncbi:hypothetical protein [Brevundimonas lenta]|uniref:Uncharacterized protein n=1 Tax=Brevundimonas lenta TaxID=424796 RepID=A0A7W6JAN9_9CAUL|nr:hypothetical protein [Brevundimonas lenta]MBB4081629.1 hypothetical protein [Brevundimonas lenta]